MHMLRSGFVGAYVTICIALLALLLAPTPVRATTPSAPTTVALAAPAIATVSVDHLNVRAGPSTSFSLLGHLRKGERVPVLRLDREWLMIYYNGGPNGYGWVNGLYLTGKGIPLTNFSFTPPPTNQTLALPKPQPLNFDGVTFAWQWSGERELATDDWYFDLQLFQANQSNPYKVLVIEPSQLQAQTGLYHFMENLDLACNSTWAIQIAVRRQGRFSHWVSPRSEQMPLGRNCAEGR